MNNQTCIAVIGAGNLGTGILRQLIQKGHKNLIATRRNQQELQKLHSLSSSLILTTNNKEAAEKADIIILATKEPSFEDIAKELGPFDNKKFIISLGPTFTLIKLKNLLGGKNIRVITPVDAHEDIICYTTDESCQKNDQEIIQSIFGKNALKIDETDMPIATAYVLLRGILNSFFEPLCDIGIKAGLNEKLAKKIVSSMLISAGNEISHGIKADERLGKASSGFNEQSFTMRLHKQLEPARKLLQELFEKVCEEFKK